jgi:chemotaxis protein histidine kinase CheA
MENSMYPILLPYFYQCLGGKEESNPIPKLIEHTLDSFEKEVIDQAIQEGFHAYHISVRLRKDCQLKSVRVFMVMQGLEPLGDVVKSTPSAEDLEKDNFEHSFELYYLTQREQEELRNTILGVSEIEAVEIESVGRQDAHIQESLEQTFDSYQEAILEQALEQGFTGYRIQVFLREDCIIKSVRAFMVFNTLEAYGEIFKSIPTVEKLEEEEFGHCFEVYLITQTSKQELEQLILSVSEVGIRED